jgi:predicted house-cleaning noncanonical NTP pyrophosphatase (MazG superfamily)
MDRAEFITKYSTASGELNKEWFIDILKKSIDSNLKDGNPRGHRNLVISTEELAELSVELSKELRGKGDRWNTLQELADVIIVIRYIKDIFGFSDTEIARAMNVKMERLADGLEKNGYYL